MRSERGLLALNGTVTRDAPVEAGQHVSHNEVAHEQTGEPHHAGPQVAIVREVSDQFDAVGSAEPAKFHQPDQLQGKELLKRLAVDKDEDLHRHRRDQIETTFISARSNYSSTHCCSIRRCFVRSTHLLHNHIYILRYS